MDRSEGIVQNEMVPPLASQTFIQNVKTTYKDDLNSGSVDLFQPTQTLSVCVCVGGENEVSEMPSLSLFTNPFFYLDSWGPSRDCLLQ